MMVYSLMTSYSYTQYKLLNFELEYGFLLILTGTMSQYPTKIWG